MLVEGQGSPQNDLDSSRGHLLIGYNFFSLLKLFIWGYWNPLGMRNSILCIDWITRHLNFVDPFLDFTRDDSLNLLEEKVYAHWLNHFILLPVLNPSHLPHPSISPWLFTQTSVLVMSPNHSGGKVHYSYLYLFKVHIHFNEMLSLTII